LKKKQEKGGKGRGGVARDRRVAGVGRALETGGGTQHLLRKVSLRKLWASKLRRGANPHAAGGHTTVETN
jgi:hypothetical protein